MNALLAMTVGASVMLSVAAPAPTGVPELLTCEDGSKVETVQQWEGKRRGEILGFYEREVYGCRPVGRPDDLRFEAVDADAVMMDGKAVRKRVRASWSSPLGNWSFAFTAFIPKRATDVGKPSPSFAANDAVIPP